MSRLTRGPLDLKDQYILLGRHDAGQFAVALLAVLIRNSDELIVTYIDRSVASR